MMTSKLSDEIHATIIDALETMGLGSPTDEDVTDFLDVLKDHGFTIARIIEDDNAEPA